MNFHLKSKAGAVVVNFVLSVIFGLIGLFLAELIVRLVQPQALILRRPDVWHPVEGLGWKRAPHLDTMVNFGGASHVRLITDEEGNRIGSAGKVQSPGLRILAIGDSFVEALQVEYEQTMTYLLQESLTEQTGLKTEVQCAGAGGWGPNQYLLLSKSKLASARLDMQLVFLYLENDVEQVRVESYPPRHPAPYHKLRLPRRMTQAELIDAIFYPINDWLETRSHAFILFRTRMQPLLARWGLSATVIPYTVYRSAVDKNWWDLTSDVCHEIALNGARHGIPTIFILIPPAFFFREQALDDYGYEAATMDLTQAYRIMKPKLEAKGLQIVDLVPAIEARMKSGIDCFGEIDSHFNAEGHRVAANVILPVILSHWHNKRNR